MHGSKLVQQVINKVMVDGKKSRAEQIVYDALEILSKRSGREPVEALEESVKALTPVLEVRSRRVGGFPAIVQRIFPGSDRTGVNVAHQPIGGDRIRRPLPLLPDAARVDVRPFGGLLQQLADEELCVCHLVEALGAPQPLISHHLRVLRAAGLVETERHRYWTYYRLCPDALAGLGARVAGLAEGAPPPGDRRRPCC